MYSVKKAFSTTSKQKNITYILDACKENNYCQILMNFNKSVMPYHAVFQLG